MSDQFFIVERDADGLPERMRPTDPEYVRPLPGGAGYVLSDEAAADVAVASGWIEDTPEAWAEYHRESELDKPS